MRRLPYTARGDLVVVVGAPGSGTRLVARVLYAGLDMVASLVEVDDRPVDAITPRGGQPTVVHDGRHGRRRWDGPTVVRVTRDPDALARSQQARWADGFTAGFPTAAQLADDYPAAPTVAYEDLVADTGRTVAVLADRLGWEPWIYPHPEADKIAAGAPRWWRVDTEVYDANAEPGSREVRELVAA